MEFFTVQINSITYKTFRTYELALSFIIDTYGTESEDRIVVYHEEYPEDFHGQSEAHGYKTLVYSRN
jgi:hypothetical protein